MMENGPISTPAPIFALFRRYVVSESGSLHGEKFFRTVTEEFEAARAPFRWRQLVGMARYAASLVNNLSPLCSAHRTGRQKEKVLFAFPKRNYFSFDVS